MDQESTLVNAELKRQVAEILAREGVPGATIALCANARFATAAIGSRSLAGQSPAPLLRTARFPIYSITKTLIATAILRLAESGGLRLGQPVQAILPDLPPDLPAITLRQLLNHTSGLPDYGAMPAYRADLRDDPATPWTDEQFLTRTLSQGMRFEPGAGWAYSNLGYLLLKQVIERATGVSFRDALDRLVVEPAGMSHTTVVESLDDMQHLTPGFSTQLESDDVPRDISRRYHPGWVAHGLVASTALELARFIDALMRGSVIGTRSLAAMHEAVLVPFSHRFFTTPSYGLGLMIDPDSPFGVVSGHVGGGPGYSTAAFHFTSADRPAITCVALVNADAGDLGTEIAWTVAKVVEERP